MPSSIWTAHTIFSGTAPFAVFGYASGSSLKTYRTPMNGSVCICICIWTCVCLKSKVHCMKEGGVVFDKASLCVHRLITQGTLWTASSLIFHPICLVVHVITRIHSMHVFLTLQRKFLRLSWLSEHGWTIMVDLWASRNNPNRLFTPHHYE